jgi:hypothetical protein
MPTAQIRKCAAAHVYIMEFFPQNINRKDRLEPTEQKFKKSHDSVPLRWRYPRNNNKTLVAAITDTR